MLENARWLSTTEFAQAAAITPQAARKALRQGINGHPWRNRSLKVRRVLGAGGRGGLGYEVAAATLPPELLASEVVVASELVAAGPRDRLKASGQDALVLKRLEVITPALQHPIQSTERAEAIRRAASENLNSERTLYRWIAQYEVSGLRGLGRAQASNAGRRRVLVSRVFDQAFLTAGYAKGLLGTIAADFEKSLKGLWMSRAELAGATEVRRLAEFLLLELCEAKGVRLPKEAMRLSRRGVERFAHYRVVNQRRNDRKAFDDAKPRIRRDWTGLAPMERIVADVKHLDVIVTREDGTPAWPKIIAFMDAGTGRVFVHPVLLERGEGVRQEHVIEAFLAMVAQPNWGFPQGLYLDNGSEFGALVKIDSALQSLNEVGARTVIFAQPYNASAKPIESLFARLDRYVFALLPGYAGPNRMAKKTQTLGKPPQPYPGTWQEFCATVKGLIQAHNLRPVGGAWADASPVDWFQQKAAVLVGTSRGPQDVLSVEGGPKIRTTWGELAWQLGGADGFAMVADNDERGIAPGSNLLEALFKKYSPSLILIDEWVAYLRQVYKVEGLPSGSFDANLSFVQSLTEAVKASPGTLLVASLPASQIEVGGEGGQEALVRLKQTFSRVESSWRPASQEESYEIVRRRLFKEIPSDRFHHRDNTLKQYAKLYRENAGDFPQGCGDEDYRRKLEKSYPIHPEMFDQLYTSWGSLEKFQRTRGVLRLMAQVIHELWMGNDPSVMIMPGSVAISSARVEPELLHYLDASWQSIIAGDVDGITSTPYKIDQSAPNLNRYSATRRVARTIFMGTAPTHGQENKGLDDKQINLGVVQPGERPAIFGDALRRLTNQAKFMHSDLGRYWYSMSASLNRIAADRAGQIEEALVLLEIDKALGSYINGLSDRGHFDAVQVAPGSSSDVPDEAGGVRAVVLGVAHSHTGREGSEALTEAKDILIQRGTTPRVYRNMLVFLAAEQRQLDNLKASMRSALAWAEIVREIDRLNLTQSDSALAKAKLVEANETLKTRLKEAWCYLIYPVQETAQADLEWTTAKVPAQDGLLARTSKKLVSDEGLLPELGPARLDRELQKYIWNGKSHLHLKDLWEYLNRYTYMPRVKNRQVLAKTVQAAVGGMLPGPFAYAERWDEAKNTYAGLAIDHAGGAQIVIDSESVIIQPDVAEANRPKPAVVTGGDDDGHGTPPTPSTPGGGPTGTPPVAPEPVVEKNPTRFSGTVMISPDRPARVMHQIVEAIVEQLTTMAGSEVTLRLEIDAEVPSGLDRAKVRTLIENATTLGFIEKIIK